MYKIYDQLATNWYKMRMNSDLEPVDFRNIDHMWCFAGMGGSGAIGDSVCINFIRRLTYPCITCKRICCYLNTVDEEYISCSYNKCIRKYCGNSNCFRICEQHKRDCNIIAFSSGGKMEETYCIKNQYSIIKKLLINTFPTNFIS